MFDNIKSDLNALYAVIKTDVEAFVKPKQERYKKLPPPFQLRLIAKTMIVATAAGILGVIVSGIFLGAITFIATAIYVGSTTLDRLSQPGYVHKTIWGYVYDKKEQVAEDIFIGFFRGFADFMDDISGIDKKKINEIEKERVQEDYETFRARLLTNLWIELKFTLNL
jgi:hypothetical protein